jgi:hypothetical protein
MIPEGKSTSATGVWSPSCREEDVIVGESHAIPVARKEPDPVLVSVTAGGEVCMAIEVVVGNSDTIRGPKATVDRR